MLDLPRSPCRFRENKNTCGIPTPPTNGSAVGDLIGDLTDNLHNRQ
jgi:hypothetical protein